MYSQVDKTAQTPDMPPPEFPGQEPSDEMIEIEVVGDPDEAQEGGEPADEQPATGQEFDGNLAEHLDEAELTRLGLDLSLGIDEDQRSRADWLEIYRDSVKYLGLKEEKRTKPWEGACGTTHPLMLEAIVRFQSRALVKLFPTSGPASIAIKEGRVEVTPQIQIEQKRANNSLNDYLTETLKELYCETDRMLFGLADIGYAAMKCFYSDELGRTTVSFTKAENFILPYGCDNLATCQRYTEEVRRTALEVENMQRSGYYLDIPIGNFGTEEMNEVEEAKAEVIGQTPSDTLEDGVRIYEVYVDFWIEGDQFKDPDGKPSPYVVCIEQETKRVLSIRRNWSQEDPKRVKRVVFVPFLYVPGEGSYALGLVQLVGQLSSGATKLLRQLVDSGTLSNLSGVLKSRDARMKNLNTVAPGEFREVDMDSENLKNAFFPLPFKEPSAVLLQLLELIIDEAKSFSSTADLDISASSQNAPVGTTLALIERQTEVQNAVQSRMFTSFKSLLGLIVNTMRETDPDTYGEIFGRLDRMVGPGNYTIVPVGDPTATTASAAVLQLQAVAQMAAQAPGVYDLGALHRAILNKMNIEGADAIIPDKSQAQPMGLVDEQMAFLAGKPVKCYPFYNHQAHIKAHMDLLNDPMYQKILATNPAAQQIVGAIQADIAQHLAFDYRNQIEKYLGVQLPPVGQPQPPEVDSALSQLVAQAADRVNQAHAAQAQQMEAAQQAADPAYQLQKEELDIKRQDVANKHQAKVAEMTLREKDNDRRAKIEVLRIHSTEKQAQSAADNKLAEAIVNDDRERTGMALDAQSRLFDHAEHLNDKDMQQQQIDNQAEQAEAARQDAQQQPTQQ